MSNTIAPALYIPHGAGPLPVLGDPSQAPITQCLSTLGEQFAIPDAIVLISAHWIESCIHITHSAAPELIYDYYGFPPESYSIEYAAKGHPELAKTIQSLLIDANIDCVLNDNRGFDHGMFIPLTLMYPHANIPCVQISLHESMDAEFHIQLGNAIQSLRQKNIMVIGSGMSVHNIVAFMQGKLTGKESAAFSEWLLDTCCNTDYSYEQKRQKLIDWEHAPFGRFSHPTEEHLIPLHVCFGAANNHSKTTVIFNEKVMGEQSCGFSWL